MNDYSNLARSVTVRPRGTGEGRNRYVVIEGRLYPRPDQRPKFDMRKFMKLRYSFLNNLSPASPPANSPHVQNPQR